MKLQSAFETYHGYAIVVFSEINPALHGPTAAIIYSVTINDRDQAVNAFMETPSAYMQAAKRLVDKWLIQRKTQGS